MNLQTVRWRSDYFYRRYIIRNSKVLIVAALFLCISYSLVAILSTSLSNSSSFSTLPADAINDGSSPILHMQLGKNPLHTIKKNLEDANKASNDDGDAIDRENELHNANLQEEEDLTPDAIFEAKVFNPPDKNNRKDAEVRPIENNQIKSDPNAPIPIILFTFNRAEHLRRTLESIQKIRPVDSFPLFISQDGNDTGVRGIIEAFTKKDSTIQNYEYEWTGKPDSRYRTAYLKIAGHYGYALGRTFAENPTAPAVILLEDDMQLAPDFFDYFRAVLPIVQSDPTIYCASAWNDNGQSNMVRDSTALYRTDCFPGLGWLMTRELWDEMKPKWPTGFWDDWLREIDQRMDRSCIYPEVNRVYTFGEKGSSEGQFYHEYLKNIKLNPEKIAWNSMDLGYLTQPSYDSYFHDLVFAARPVHNVEDAHKAIDILYGEDPSLDPSKYAYKFDYPAADLVRLNTIIRKIQMYIVDAKPLRLIDDHKAGVPRTSYKGVLMYRYRYVRIYIVPTDF